jgi:cobalt-zinc-cadmium efflux system protein
LTTHCHQQNSQEVPNQLNKAFLIAIISNSLFVIVQIAYAYVANSTSLLADGIHNLGDVLSLLLAWGANYLMGRSPTIRATYGLKKTSILAASINGFLMIFTCGIIVTEATYKLITPTEIQTIPVMIVASLGILVNGLSAALFSRSQDLNIKGAFLHLFYDALVSVGVVLAAILIYWTQWFWVDSLTSYLIAIIILKGTWSLFKDSFRLLLDGVPRGISLPEVLKFLNSYPGVEGVHDLHIWALSTRENAISVHLLMPVHPFTDEERAVLEKNIHEKFNIQHVTIQIEKLKTFCVDDCAIL